MKRDNSLATIGSVRGKRGISRSMKFLLENQIIPIDSREKVEKDFIPKIYFIRQVREDREEDKGAFIDILNERVSLPEPYINYFVLSEWNLKEEILYIYFEKEQKPEIIKETSFKINQRSKEKLEKLFQR